MDHAKKINDLMPCDKSGDFLAVWVEVKENGFDEELFIMKAGDSGPLMVGELQEPRPVIAALEALPEHARPQYLVEAAS